MGRPLLDLLVGNPGQAALHAVPAVDDAAAALRQLEGDALRGVDAAAHADDAVAESREVVGESVDGPARGLIFLDDGMHKRADALQGVGESGELGKLDKEENKQTAMNL